MKYGALTKADVRKIFDKEAVLIGHSDNVPTASAERYFPQEALDFARHMSKPVLQTCNMYGIGAKCENFGYFTLAGLELAATYANITAFLNARKASVRNAHGVRTVKSSKEAADEGTHQL